MLQLHAYCMPAVSGIWKQKIYCFKTILASVQNTLCVIRIKSAILVEISELWCALLFMVRISTLKSV